MTKIIRVSLTQEQRAELNRRARQRVLAPRLRERIEMIRLSDLGWTIPKIAASLGINEQTVRKHIKAFLKEGFDALPDRPRPGRPRSILPADLDALEQTLEARLKDGHTWKASEMVRWLAERRGVSVTPRHLSRLLQQRKLPRANHSHSKQRRRPDSAVRNRSAVAGWSRSSAKAITADR